MKRLVYPLLLLSLMAAILFPMTAAAAGPQWVVVNWGDTLYSIAARYGTTVNAMLQANHLPDANFVFAGQRLLVPGSAAPVAPVSGPSSNTTTSSY